MEESLSCVNGGAGASDNESPNSEVPYKGNYYTSWGLSATAVTSAAKKTLSVFEPGWLDDKVR